MDDDVGVMEYWLTSKDLDVRRYVDGYGYLCYGCDNAYLDISRSAWIPYFVCSVCGKAGPEVLLSCFCHDKYCAWEALNANLKWVGQACDGTGTCGKTLQNETVYKVKSHTNCTHNKSVAHKYCAHNWNGVEHD